MSLNQMFGARFSLLTLALAAAFPLALVSGPASAAEEEAESAPPAKRDRMRELIDTLKEKGVISEEEYTGLTEESAEDRAEARAQRRRDALKRAQETEQAEQRKNQFVGRWNNGLVFETPDRATGFALSGRVHSDYRAFLDDSAPSTFEVRRAYLTVAGKWNDWITWDVTGDFAQSTTTLDVGWVNLAFSESAQLRMGQFKMPMALEELTSSRFIDFQERSFVDRFAPAKERGMMLHGIPRPGMTYALALSNGQGKNNNETTPQADRPDLIGRLSINAAEWVGAQANSIYHVGLAASDGSQANTFNVSSGLTTEARGGAFFTTSAFSGTTVDRRRMAAELALARGPVKLQAEWLNTNYTGRSAAGVAYDRDVETYYLSLLWMVTGERYSETYRNGVFGRMVPYSNFTPGGSGTGAFELGLRLSGFNADDFKTTNAAGTGALASATTATNRANTITLQAKWIWNANLKFYLDFIQTKFDNPIRFATGNVTTDMERAITFRGALDF